MLILPTLENRQMWLRRYANSKNDIRIIIAGTRTFIDYDALYDATNQVIAKLKEDLPSHDITIISGNAPGADRLGERYARKCGYGLKIFPAQWSAYGKMAGPMRNRQMLSYATEGIPVVIAFWDGVSRGTRNMIDIALDANALVYLYQIPTGGSR